MGHFSKNKIHLKLSMKLNFPNMHYICPNFEPNIFMHIGNGWADNVLVTVWFEACWAAPNYHDPYSGESVVTDFHRLDNSALTAAGIGMKSLDPGFIQRIQSPASLGKNGYSRNWYYSLFPMLVWPKSNRTPLGHYFVVHLKLPRCTWDHPGAQLCPGPDLGGDRPGHHPWSH